MPGGVAAGAMDEHPRRHLVLVLERPHLAVVLFQEPLARPPKRVWEPWCMETREKSGDSQNLASAAARWTRRSGRSRSLTPSTSSPPQWSMCRWVSTTSSGERIVRQVESGQTPEAERRVNRPLFVPGCDLPRLNLVRLLVDTNRAPLSRRPQRR